LLYLRRIIIFLAYLVFAPIFLLLLIPLGLCVFIKVKYFGTREESSTLSKKIFFYILLFPLTFALGFAAYVILIPAAYIVGIPYLIIFLQLEKKEREKEAERELIWRFELAKKLE